MTTHQPFAIMRLTHDAIRCGLDELEAACNEAGFGISGRLLEGWLQTSRAIRLHSKQEDEALHPPLHSRRPGVAVHFTDAHDEERRRFARIDETIERGRSDASAVGDSKRLVFEWIAEHRAHLAEEDATISPLLSNVFSHRESVYVVRGILETDLDEFANHQLPWVFRRLGPSQRLTYLAMLNLCSPRQQRERLFESVQPLLGEAETRRFFEMSQFSS